MTTQFGADEQRQKRLLAERVEFGHQPVGWKSSSLQLVCGALLRLFRLATWAIVEQLAKLINLGQQRVESAKCLPVRQLESDISEQKVRVERNAVTQNEHNSTKANRIPPVQMSQEIVAGFEEQQVAHELSAKVVEEALQAIIQRLEMATASEQQQDQPFVGGGDAAGQLLEANEQDTERAARDQLGSSLEGSLTISSVDSLDEDEQDEHCGRQASQNNLRLLKLSTLEDVLVCDRRRHKTNAARHLFNQLAATSNGAANGQSPKVLANQTKRLITNQVQRGSSLSSRSSFDDDNNSSGSNPIDIDYLEELLGRSSQPNDCGTIKLDRRCCSSSSSSSVNFGRTLVCSVSPTGQFHLGRTTTNNLNTKTLNVHEPGAELNENCAEYDPNYPINGDEIRQCRTAFRENRRLIEQAQIEACRKMNEGVGLSRSVSQAAMRSSGIAPDRSRWAESLGRRSKLPNCSRCQQKLYPIDKLDLDFARATLNIHRNCFKCQVCATLLRLETYASIDAKLYCPAHVKCVAPSR